MRRTPFAGFLLASAAVMAVLGVSMSSASAEPKPETKAKGHADLILKDVGDKPTDKMCVYDGSLHFFAQNNGWARYGTLCNVIRNVPVYAQVKDKDVVVDTSKIIGRKNDMTKAGTNAQFFVCQKYSKQHKHWFAWTSVRTDASDKKKTAWGYVNTGHILAGKHSGKEGKLFAFRECDKETQKEYEKRIDFMRS